MWPQAHRCRAQAGDLKASVIFERAADERRRPGRPRLVHLHAKRCSTDVDQRIARVVERRLLDVERLCLDPHHEWRLADRHRVDVRVPALSFAGVRYLLGLSEEEAAAALGVRVGTVKSRCSRARRALLEELG